MEDLLVERVTTNRLTSSESSSFSATPITPFNVSNSNENLSDRNGPLINSTSENQVSQITNHGDEDLISQISSSHTSTIKRENSSRINSSRTKRNSIVEHEDSSNIFQIMVKPVPLAFARAALLTPLPRSLPDNIPKITRKRRKSLPSSSIAIDSLPLNVPYSTEIEEIPQQNSVKTSFPKEWADIYYWWKDKFG